jgi:nitrite reductase/ring-hydroxylating ferredoxin subunit
MTEHASTRWTRVGPLAQFEPGGHTVKVDKHQLAVLRAEGGDIHVIDNRCPHEGYPLAQGKLDGCVLTCAWHNWKFDLRDGRSVLGGEGVRIYPCRVRDGALEVDLADPDPAVLVPGLERSLREGLFQRDAGRAYRDGARLVSIGVPMSRLLWIAVHDDAVRAEYGTTHVLPMAADAFHQLEGKAGLEAMHPIAQVLDLAAETNVRLPPRPAPAPLHGGSADEVVSAIEREDLARAEGLVRGALLAGVPRAEVHRWLIAAASAHFLDFGHPLIYLVKTEELFARAEGGAAPSREEIADIYGALTYNIGVGTREDTLPYMRSYFHRYAELQTGPGASRPEVAVNLDDLRRAALDGSSEEAVLALSRALRSGIDPERIAVALVSAAAERLFRFDLEVDRDPNVQEGWLWVTHRLTFASAARLALRDHRSPEALWLLVQTLAFTHTGRGMDAPPARRFEVIPEPASVEDVIAAILAKDPVRAVGRAAFHLRNERSIAALGRALLDACTRDIFVRPIYAAHALKTTAVALSEYEINPDETLILAAVRFLASPAQERPVRRDVTAAIRWIAEGKPPRKLTQ